MKNTSVAFASTRSEKLEVPFWKSIVQGMAEDGGLLVPVDLPALPPKLLKSKEWWSSLKTSDIAFEILKLFVPEKDIPSGVLKKDMEDALDFLMPLERVGKGNDYVLRLDQGPTASFKDIAARTLAKLMEHYAEAHDEKINIVVATSGDTGVAIADAFGGSKRITVTVLYPHGGVSEVQEKQMVEVHHKYENEQVMPVKGNFDNCQDIAKLLQAARSTDAKQLSAYAEEVSSKLGISFSKEEASSVVEKVASLDLSSANSINIWRLIPQMTQYFAGYAALVKKGAIKPGEKISFSVPTGNVGHLMAGIYAKELGLPVLRFIIGTNTNNILANIIGESVVRHRPFVPSSAPSMDILDPSNLERLLHFAAMKTGFRGKIDYVQMKKDIKRIESHHQSFHLSDYGVTEEMISYIRDLVWAEDVETDQEMYAMMRDVQARTGIVLEPHGVTGYIALLRARAKGEIAPDTKVVVFETAHPDKFPDSLKNSGLGKAKHAKHSSLGRLEKKDLKKMQVPKAVPIGLQKVADAIGKIANN